MVNHSYLRHPLCLWRCRMKRCDRPWKLLDVNSILESQIHFTCQQKLCSEEHPPQTLRLLSLGNAMENRGASAVSKSRSVKQRGGALRQQGGRSGFAVGFWAAASALLLAGFVGLFVLFTPPVSANKSIAAADTHRLAAIVRDDGGTICVHATFDNVTGSICEKRPMCESTVITGAADKSSALGTMRLSTQSAIISENELAPPQLGLASDG
jgi:hypothetical protein